MYLTTLGRALATTEEEAYPILESLDVDYVLVVFGGTYSIVEQDEGRIG